ncbi:ERCC4 domain-containing protein [Trichoderma ceciliae]
MASHVIDLISSSPPLPAHREPPPSRCAPAAPASASSTAIEGGRNKHRRSHSPLLFVSSDFDITDDDFLGQDARNTKRLRISTSPQPPPSFNPSRTARRPFCNATLDRPSRLEFDAIEFTSSLDPDTPKTQQNTTQATGPRLAEPHPTEQISKAPPQISLGSDPFASSPLPPPAIEPEEGARKCTATIIDDFSDPFASSPLPPLLPPPRQTHKPREQPKPLQTRLNIDEFSDPFASSHQTNLLQPTKASTPRRAVSVEMVDYSRRHEHWDPISSSAPEQTSRVSPAKKTTTESHTAGPTIISIDSDSAGTSEDEFPDIANFNVSQGRPRPHPHPRPRFHIRRSHSETISSRSSIPKSATTATATATATTKTSEQRARDRDAQAAVKAAEKERKRQEKQQVKETKALEKERAAALAEVNKVRTDKKVSAPEMILIMPLSVDEGLKIQLVTLLDGLSVEYTTRDSPVANAFKWRRKVRSRFDEEMGRWEPIPLQIKPENHALILLTAEEFVKLAVSDTVETSVSQTKRHFPGHEIIYILEGIIPWMKKNRNIRNRRFTSGVRAQDQAAPEAATTSTAGSSRRRRNNAATEEYISEDIIEDAMLRLQVQHDVLIHHTAVPLETAQWIVAFTQHISTIPYKKMRDKMTSTAGFCMESGQVRTGDDTRDTYVRMLQEIARVTAPIAYGIVSEFDTVSKLVKGLEQGGPLRLESVRKSANKDGAASDRMVGQAVSRRIHRVFTGRDEMSTDV